MQLRTRTTTYFPQVFREDTGEVTEEPRSPSGLHDPDFEVPREDPPTFDTVGLGQVWVKEKDGGR